MMVLNYSSLNQSDEHVGYEYELNYYVIMLLRNIYVIIKKLTCLGWGAYNINGYVMILKNIRRKHIKYLVVVNSRSNNSFIINNP